MKKLNLDTLVVESFSTVDPPRQPRGTVMGRQVTYELVGTCGAGNTCDHTCYADVATCDVSCRATKCVTACQGGGELTKGCEPTE